ncbi:MAG: hypothetical protein HFH72_08910 [Lachnospiraceae bacterium]|nr:hypothetical protein [Lachnospiraceae bacterium]
MNDIKNKMDIRTPIEIALDIGEDGMTTARKLYEFLELAKGQFSRWSKTNITENPFAEENVDYWGFDINVEGNIVQDFKLSAKFAKKLSMQGKNEKAEQARDYFSSLDDGIKSMAEDFNSFSPELRLLIKMELRQKEQDKKMLAMQDNIKRLEAKVTTHNDDYFTVAGYASLRGLNVDINKANMLGRKASKLSREYGYDIGKVKDTRYGSVNTYHVDILKEVFKR